MIVYFIFQLNIVILLTMHKSYRCPRSSAHDRSPSWLCYDEMKLVLQKGNYLDLIHLHIICLFALTVNPWQSLTD
jgi:hypothetical protein